MACKKLEGRLLPINKVPGKVPRPDEVRPIEMPTHTVKFLEECLRPKLKKYVESNSKVRFANQYGFQSGLSIFAAHRKYLGDVDIISKKLKSK